MVFTSFLYHALLLVYTFNLTCAFSQKVAPITQDRTTSLIMVAPPHCGTVAKQYFLLNELNDEENLKNLFMYVMRTRKVTLMMLLITQGSLSFFLSSIPHPLDILSTQRYQN